MTTLAFDVYGTLINTHGVVSALEGLVGDNAKTFSSTWRDKQLEYSFRKGLMQNYETFAVCTRQALDYTCSYYGAALNDEQKKGLMSLYRTLPAFDDVKEGLTRLNTAGFRLFAFSNGAAEALEVLLQLQYKRNEADAMIQKALTRSTAIKTTEELLNEIYKQRMKK